MEQCGLTTRLFNFGKSCLYTAATSDIHNGPHVGTHHNPVCLPFQQGHSEVAYRHNDLFNNWQRRVPVLLIDYFHTECRQSLRGEAGFSQCIGAGGHEAEQHSIKSAAVCVTVYSARRSGRHPAGASSLRTTDLALRALREGAGELASSTVAAGGLICPELCVRFTLVPCGGCESKQ